jgi:hypothetical protein
MGSVLIEIFLNAPSPCSQCLRGDKNTKTFHHGDTENTETDLGCETRTLLSNAVR